MPWKERRIVDQREQFITDWLKRKEPLTWLCKQYGISRKTGSKWVSRFINGGRDQH